MSLRKLFAAASLAAVLFSTPLLRAHDEGGEGKGMHDGGWDKGDMMKDALGLTDAQAEKMKAAKKANMEALKPLRAAIKADFKKLHEQVKAKASDADLKATLNRIEKDGEAIRTTELKHRDKMKAILTPTQQAKIALWMGGRMKHRMEKMHGGEHEHEDKDEDADEGDE